MAGGFVSQLYKLESCWTASQNRSSWIGLVVHMQLRRADGTWYTPEHIPGKLADPATVPGTRCPKGLNDLSAITYWTPPQRGVYYARHVILPDYKNTNVNIESKTIYEILIN